MRSTALITWRFVVVAGFAFWQGGFFFYTSVVVPTAQEVIGGLQQGFITRQVTVVLNASGAVVLVLFAMNAIWQNDPRRSWRWVAWVGWVGMVCCQAWLFLLHPDLEALLDFETFTVTDRDTFRAWHRVYLWVSTALWGLGVVVMIAVVAAWRRRDFDEGRG